MYKKFVGMHLKTSLEFRMNTIMIIISQLFISFGELISIYLMFKRFESVGEWGFYESALMFGLITTIFSFCECFARGYDDFATLVKNGELDRMLIRPVNIHKQIFGSKIEFVKLFKTLLGLIVTIIALSNINVSWNVYKVLVLLSAFICGDFVILGVFMVSAGISIYTINNLEFLNIITDGSKELAYYPLNIYKKWLTRIFTFVIPIACFNYLPLSFITGKGSVPMWLCGISPLFGMLFFIPCLLFFNFSLKKYQGTGT